MWACRIPDASNEILPKLVNREAEHIRIVDHLVSPEVSWWTASLPLARDGDNRNVLVNGVRFDLALSTADLLTYIGDFRKVGMELIQSRQPLPADAAPHLFWKRQTYLRFIQKFGGTLLFELPHANETACVTFFERPDFDRFSAMDLGEQIPMVSE